MADKTKPTWPDLTCGAKEEMTVKSEIETRKHILNEITKLLKEQDQCCLYSVWYPMPLVSEAQSSQYLTQHPFSL